MNDLTLQERLAGAPRCRPVTRGHPRHRRVLARDLQAALEHSWADPCCGGPRRAHRIVDAAGLSRHRDATDRAGQIEGRLHRGGLQPRAHPARVLPDASRDPEERRACAKGGPEAQAHNHPDYDPRQAEPGWYRAAPRLWLGPTRRRRHRRRRPEECRRAIQEGSCRYSSSATASSRRSASVPTTGSLPRRCRMRSPTCTSRTTSRRAWR